MQSDTPRTKEVYSSELKIEQVLEQLEYALSEYQSKKMYKRTADRYSQIADKAYKCYLLASKLSNLSESAEPTDIQKDVSVKPEDCDILDTFGFDTLLPLENSEESSSKTFSKFASGFERCSEISCGISEINMFSRLSYRWFKTRYEDCPFPNGYRIDQINSWYDKMIISAGYAISQNTFQDFYHDVDDWLSRLIYEPSKYSIPKFVYVDGTSELSDHYTPEAIVIERIIKPILYQSNFLIEYMHTVEHTVLSHNIDYSLFKSNDLIRESNFTIKSDFDINILGE